MTHFVLICKPLLTMLLSTVLCSASVCQHRNDCSGNGECMLGVCQCDTGYTGTHCEKGLCLQKDTETCNHVLVAAACRSLSSTGIAAPLSCLQQTAAPPGGCSHSASTMGSCQEIFRSCRSASSGNYQLQLANGSLVEVYCDMEGSNCGGQGGWTRVAFINMTEPGAICPHDLTQRNISGRILCTRRGQPGCQGTIFSTLGLNYNQVCGRVIGYQQGAPEAFQSAGFNTINSAYINGVSITHGSPRQHIWSFAAGPTINVQSSFGCPCNEGSHASPPSYVGSNYYCESGTAIVDSDRSKLYASDPLWDGQQCTGLEGPCCANPSLPWFNTTLPNTSTDDIELRLCFNEPSGREDSPLELMELYIR